MEDPNLRIQERMFELQVKDLEIRRRAVELPVELASLGLRGTLTGAIAGALLLAILPVYSIISERVDIKGWHLCILAGIICTTVATYGAFVFQKSFNVALAWKDKVLSVGVPQDPGGKAEQ